MTSSDQCITCERYRLVDDACEAFSCGIPDEILKPKSGRIAVKVINHLGDDEMKVCRI